MNELAKRLALSIDEQEKQGISETAREIAQQPACWQETRLLWLQQRDILRELLNACGIPGSAKAHVMLCGAGTSEFVGESVEGALRKELGVVVESRPTTDMLTYARHLFIPGRDYLVVSFARSGNSPESIGTYNLVKRDVPGARQLVITCNAQGALAFQTKVDANGYTFVLPAATNDRGLAMTSSFSTMALVAYGLAFLDNPDGYKKLVDTLSHAGQQILDNSDKLYQFAQRPWKRGVFLGSNTLYGVAREAHLKSTELTDGQVMCRYDSFLGLRHGPQVVITPECFVMAFISDDQRTARYELDLLQNLKARGKVGGIFVITPHFNERIQHVADDYIELLPASVALDDQYRAPCDVIAAQLLGFYLSLCHGLRPDNPCTDGTISRVVEGVTVYE